MPQLRLAYAGLESRQGRAGCVSAQLNRLGGIHVTSKNNRIIFNTRVKLYNGVHP